MEVKRDKLQTFIQKQSIGEARQLKAVQAVFQH